MIRRIPRGNDLKEDERCTKHQDEIANRIAKPEQEEEFENYEEEIHEIQEELPFQDILADQRRKYSATQKYVQLIYNDLVKIFVKKWDGTFLRKTVIPKQSCDSFSSVVKEEEEGPTKEDIEKTIDEEKTTLDWDLYKPDEMVAIVFDNGNSYSGRTSNQKMEGEGIYRWHHGSKYKGAFEDNKIQGKGLLEWQDCVQYEGDFVDGYLHGKGTMVDKNYKLLYIGEWRKGQKHGKGYCRYEKNDSYDGDWVMDKREGVGNRLYPNGTRYIGDWKNGRRHGTGTMIWPNGDFYRGEWNQGQMHGNGEYIWNRFFDERLCWPQEISYTGQWYQGTRNGKGQLTLNTIGGARYSGEWKENNKHGYGKIIGNNGDVTEGDPLFQNNILLPIPTEDLEGDLKKTTKNLKKEKDKNNTKENHGSYLPKFVTDTCNIPEPRITSVLKPEQCPSLSYYIDRMREEDISCSSRTSLLSEKCKECEDMSCHCLRQMNDQSSPDQEKPSRSLTKETTLKDLSGSAKSSSSLDQKHGDRAPTDFAKTNNLESIELGGEERHSHNCIAMHMPRICKIYDMYSKVFCDESPNCRLSMSRLSLWQLWRDCGIHKKSLNLVQIDKYLAANKSTLMEDPHFPYERIQIWQLIHALLEVSWHLYIKNKDIDKEVWPGKLANGLHKLLVNDIYPNFGNFTGILCGPERDLLPINLVYKLYKSIGEPHTARQLLKSIHSIQGTSEGEISLSPGTANFIPNGKNFMGEYLSYPPSSESVLHPKSNLLISADSLNTLQKLEVSELTETMNFICPSIKDPETDIIVNMEYEFTFLEFLEIFIEAGKRLVSKTNIQRKVDQKKSEALETISILSTAKADRTSRSTSRLSGGSKSTKSRKKLVKKH